MPSRTVKRRRLGQREDGSERYRAVAPHDVWAVDYLFDATADADHDNLRAALRRCVADGEALLVLRIAGALWQFWRIHGVADEARAWCQQALALPGGGTPTRERAKALAGAGVLALRPRRLR